MLPATLQSVLRVHVRSNDWDALDQAAAAAHPGDCLAVFYEEAREGNALTLARLLPHVDPKAQDSRALRLVSIRGNLAALQLLIPVSDPAANFSEALRNVVQARNHAAAELLLPYSDLSSQRYEAVCQAAENADHVMLQILAPAADFVAAFGALSGYKPSAAVRLLPFIPQSQHRSLLFARHLDSADCVHPLRERVILEEEIAAASGAPRPRM